jgi:hypothetical protein
MPVRLGPMVDNAEGANEGGSTSQKVMAKVSPKAQRSRGRAAIHFGKALKESSHRPLHLL